jgi:hypothetical protein
MTFSISLHRSGQLASTPFQTTIKERGVAAPTKLKPNPPNPPTRDWFIGGLPTLSRLQLSDWRGSVMVGILGVRRMTRLPPLYITMGKTPYLEHHGDFE